MDEQWWHMESAVFGQQPAGTVKGKANRPGVTMGGGGGEKNPMMDLTEARRC